MIKKINFKTIFKIISGIPIFTLFSTYSYIQIKSNFSNKKLNIIFDLDETLIYTDKIINYSNSNVENMLKPEPYEITSNRKIWIRTGVVYLVPILAKFNNLYLFTKASEPYTLDILTKTNLNKYFLNKKYREDCKNTCKDLNKFGLEGYSLLIDDKIRNQCGKQNFYHIPKFNCWTKYDFYFFKLFGYILWLNIVNDINYLTNKN